MKNAEVLTPSKELAVLLVAPTGRDAEITASVLEKNGIAAEIYPDVEALCKRLDEPAGAVLIAEEGLISNSFSDFKKKLQEQPAWSDLPVILLISNHISEQTNAEIFGFFEGNNINFLERPLRSITLLSTLHSALKARKRQYQVRDLINEQARYLGELQQANQEWEKKNKELEQFAYVASHDLQEPLRTVVTFCQMIQARLQNHLDNETTVYMKHLTEAAMRARQLVRDLLSYSRIDKDYESHFIDLNRVFSNARDNLRVLIEENNAELTRDHLPSLRANETQMIQLFQNLIGNAIKFKRELPPRIHISSYTRREHGQEQWVISVQDNGIGIEPQYWERIFVIFQRLQTQQEGTGIGLAVCKKIVEHHKGNIWIDSELGKGTTLYLSFPKGRPE